MRKKIFYYMAAELVPVKYLLLTRVKRIEHVRCVYTTYARDGRF